MKSNIPNTITLTSAFFGILSIMYSIDKSFNLAIICIFIAIILDGLDGSLARLLNSESQSGKILDSISDMISFSFAPGFLIYSHYYDLTKGTSFQSLDNSLVVLTSSMIIICGIYRLARFMETDKKEFEGLPTPAFAMFISLSFIVLQGSYFVIFLAFTGSILMVTRIKYPKLRGWIKIVIGSLLIIQIIGFLMGILLISILNLILALGYVFEPVIIKRDKPVKCTTGGTIIADNQGE